VFPMLGGVATLPARAAFVIDKSGVIQLQRAKPRQQGPAQFQRGQGNVED